MRAALLLGLTASAFVADVDNVRNSPYTYNETMRISSVSLTSGSPLGKASQLTSWEFSHSLTVDSQHSADAYNFPIDWLNMLDEFNVTRIVASVVRGKLPAGGAVWAEHDRVSGLIDAPSGSLLEVTFATPLRGIALERAWLRMAPLVARACGGGTTGASVVPPESAPGGIAPVSPGVPRDWYTVFQDGRPQVGDDGDEDPRHSRRRSHHVRLALPRARVGGEAIRSAVSTGACRAHAGLGAAVIPRIVLDGDWMGVQWLAERVCEHPSLCRVSLSVMIASLIPLPRNKTLGDALGNPDWGKGVGRRSVCAVASKSEVIAGEAIVSLLDAPLIDAGYLAQQAEAHGLQKTMSAESLLLRRCITGSRSHTVAFLGGGTVFVTLRNICDSKTWGNEVKGFATLFETIPWLISRVTNSSILLVDARGRMMSGDAQEQTQRQGQRRQWVRIEDAVADESRAGAQRGPPTVTVLTVPLPSAGTDSLISWRFESSSGLAHAEESPPDAHHGIEMPSVRVHACLAGSDDYNYTRGGTCGTSGTASSREWTLPCLTGACTFEVPVTDFSMPYNVAVLISTATAFSLGSFVNALARKKRK